MCELLYDCLRAGKVWKAPRTEELAETNHSNVVSMDVDSFHSKGGKGMKDKGKGKNKGDRPRHDGKGKSEQSVKQRYFDGYCNQCGEYGHKKPDCAGKNKFFTGTCNKCGAQEHKRVDCSVKRVAHLESESVIEPNEEPAGIESLNGFTHRSMMVRQWPVSQLRLFGYFWIVDLVCRLVLLSFAPHVKTLTGSSVRARSATGQVIKSQGKKTVNFDINGIAACVNMEVLRISKPIVSAGKMVRSGRRIVLDEHDSFIEDKKTVKRIPVELTCGDVFEISAYMSPNSHGLLKKPV